MSLLDNVAKPGKPSLPPSTTPRKRRRAHTSAGPTMAQVAEVAGVSTRTASLVLNQRDQEARIAPETAQRVRAAARELDYQPQAAARALASRRSFLVGLVLWGLKTIGVPEMSALLSGLADRLSLDGYGAIPLVSNPDWAREYGGLHYAAWAFNRSVDGLVLHDHLLPQEAYQELAERGVHFVSVDAPVLHCPDRWLPLDHKGAGRWAARHLIDCGYRKLAFLDVSPFPVESDDRKWKGFQSEALAEPGAPLTCQRVGAHSEPLHEHLKALLESGLEERVGLYLSAAQEVARVYRAAAELGIRIPEDLGVVGHGDDPQNEFFHPSLTDVAFSLFEAGERAGDMLLAQIVGRASPDTHAPVPVRAVVRRSCGEGPDEGGEDVHRRTPIQAVECGSKP